MTVLLFSLLSKVMPNVLPHILGSDRCLHFQGKSLYPSTTFFVLSFIFLRQVVLQTRPNPRGYKMSLPPYSLLSSCFLLFFFLHIFFSRHLHTHPYTFFLFVSINPTVYQIFVLGLHLYQYLIPSCRIFSLSKIPPSLQDLLIAPHPEES